MAEYNNLSIDIDLEDMFDNLSEDGQEEFLIGMFDHLPDGDSQKDVIETNLINFDDDEAISDIITDTFWSMNSSNQKEIAERIADVMTPEQREALIEYINGI